MNQLLVTATNLRKQKFESIEEVKPRQKQVRSSSVTERKISIEKAKKSFVNYMISEEIENADLDQIEMFQLQRLIKSNDELDELQKQVYDAEAKLKILEMQIEKEIITNFKLNDEELKEEIDNEINELKQLIKIY